MGSFPELLLLSSIMGLSIFVSLPLVLHRRAQGRVGVLINAMAIGILVFLLADIFSNVAPLIADPTAQFLTFPLYDAIFAIAVTLAFLVLMAVESPARGAPDRGPAWTAAVIALAIGFQNFTEGLVFGNSWAAGTIGLLAVIFAGFLLQNISEGFPIASPFLSQSERPALLLVALFLVGGIPTILGAGVGFFFQSAPITLLFDGFAIGTLLYIIAPMLKGALRPGDTPEATRQRTRIVYLGILAGFLLGFLVNAL
jgi:ZIP family zinc transporter